MTETLHRYNPRGTEPDTFDKVRGQCVEAVLHSAPATVASARTRMSIAARFALFLLEHALWLPAADEEHVLPATPWQVQNYVASLPKAQRPSARSHLASIGRGHLPHLWNLPYVEDDTGPYLKVDVEAIWNAASSIRHDHDDPTVAAYVAAAFGAGLAGKDFRTVTGLHVVRDPERHVYVEVRGNGPRDRTVPVAAPWDARLHAVADSLGDTLLIGGTEPSDNVLAAVSQRARRAGLATLSSRRMRATWLRARMQDGVPLDVLMRYSGAASSHGFDRLLPWLTPRSVEMELAMVRGDLTRR